MNVVKEDSEWDDSDSEKSMGVDAQSFKSYALKSSSKFFSRKYKTIVKPFSFETRIKPPIVRSVRLIKNKKQYAKFLRFTHAHSMRILAGRWFMNRK